MNKYNNSSGNQALKIVEDDYSKKEITTVFHKVKSYINEYYELRFNTISLEIEITEINNDNWQQCNENSLWVEIQEKGIKIGQNALKAILKSEFVPAYNPLITYFENLTPWDGKTDYISQYADFVKLEPTEDREQFLYHFKKWCVRSVKCVLNEKYFNKQAFILTDNGKGQNIGKSTWCRFLCPPALSNYLAEDISNNDKDTRILICKNFLINLDELAALSKKDINQLKSLFSKDKINDRLPYESKNSIIPRVASFIGSTNMSTFLHDETGSVRWLCFVVETIDWDYKHNFDIDNLWRQAFSLSKSQNFKAELTGEDISKNEERNNKFQHLSVERELLNEYLEHSNQKEGKHLSSTQIAIYLKAQSGTPINAVQMGKALTAAKFERTKYNGTYGYWIKYKPIQ